MDFLRYFQILQPVLMEAVEVENANNVLEEKKLILASIKPRINNPTRNMPQPIPDWSLYSIPLKLFYR